MLTHDSHDIAARTANSGAKSGDPQSAALALIADHLNKSLNQIPGGGWMVTEVSAPDEDGNEYVDTWPVLVFSADGEPLKPELPDGLFPPASQPDIGVCLWHPTQYVNGRQMTAWAAKSIARANIRERA